MWSREHFTRSMGFAPTRMSRFHSGPPRPVLCLLSCLLSRNDGGELRRVLLLRPREAYCIDPEERELIHSVLEVERLLILEEHLLGEPCDHSAEGMRRK